MPLFDEEGRSRAFEMLGHIQTPHLEWKRPLARESFEDFFGVPVRHGEAYHSNRDPRYRNERIKLSDESMEKLLFLMFELHPLLPHVAEIRKRRDEQQMDAFMRKFEESVPDHAESLPPRG